MGSTLPQLLEINGSLPAAVHTSKSKARVIRNYGKKLIRGVSAPHNTPSMHT